MILSVHSLKDSIEGVLTGIRHMGKFEIKFTSVINEYTDCSLARDKKLAFLRIMMARLGNIIRYSPAKRVRVSLMQLNMDIILYIYDDGAVPDGRDVHQQRSMSFIDARVRSFGGRMDILTTPDGGYSVTVLLPYHSLSTTT